MSTGITKYRNFNPLPRKEGDPRFRDSSRTAEISIHSLVKRETFLEYEIKRKGIKFQSTPS